MIHSINKQTPLSYLYLLEDDYKSGDITYQGAGGELYYSPTKSDTVSLLTGVNRTVVKRYDKSIKTLFQTNIQLKNSLKNKSIKDKYLNVDGGISIFSLEDSIVVTPNFSILGSYNYSNFTTQTWIKSAIAPINIPYDTLNRVTLNSSIDNYLSFGTKLYWHKDKLSLNLGYSDIIGANNSTIERYWYDNRTPYENPSNVFSITPSFGEWHGISATTSWLFSDKLPTFKSTSNINFHFNRNGRSRHLYLNFSYHYWSKKEISSFGVHPNSDSITEPSPVWNRSIHDLGLKITAETKAFRLFWKMDNILNRKNSYIPGYYMPGTIFRWGFSWTVTG